MISSVRIAGLVIVILALGTLPHPARAVPSFAQQTGQPCTACHVGGFGPQLTPFGRAFKIGGYTLDGGEGAAARVPLAAFILNSFTHTNTSQPQPAADHFGRNNNFALDQVSVFLAGRVSDNIGGFVQGTYSGVDRAFSLDSTDLRLTAPLSLGESELRVGVSVNNGPTVQDPFNTTFAWIFPYASSSLAPTPTAQPLLAGGLIGNSIGITGYAWYDQHFYAEFGGYGTYGRTLLSATGAGLGPGSTANPAPYIRLAYQWDWPGQSAHVGALFLHANLNPTTPDFTTTGAFGRDRYTDYGIDAGYQWLGDGRHIVSAYTVFVHEELNLQSSFNQGAASQASGTLNQMRANVGYFFANTYGLTLGWQYTWGAADPALFPAAPVSGSANGKPDSNAFILEADWIPFGKADSWARPFANLKIGLQYTAYTLFNGGTRNYDGFGRNAADNNTLFLYAWTAF